MSGGINFYEAGSADGRPLLFFHGFPGSRLQARFLDPYVNELNLRLLAPDRPGYGGSPARRPASLTAFANDVVAALDARGIGEVTVLGVSGGTPAAVTVARRLGPRLRALGIVSGLGPWALDRKGFSRGQNIALGAARVLPSAFLLRLFGALLRRRDPVRALDQFAQRLHAVDRAVLTNPAIRPLLFASVEEAFRQGPAGVVFDAKTFVTPWAKGEPAIQAPVRIWHGEDDWLLAPSMGKALRRQLPGAVFVRVPREGHYSLAIGRARELLTELLG